MSELALNPKEPDFTSLLERGNFITRFAGGDSRNRCVNRLHRLLERIDPEASFAAQAEWLEDTGGWMFERGNTPGRKRGERNATARLRLFLDVLDELPETRTRLRGVVVEAFRALDPTRLFTDTGLPTQAGVFTEAFDRLARNLLPEPPVENDAARLLYRLFPDRRAATWFESVPPPVLERLFDTLSVPQGRALAPVMQAMRDATVLLATRIAAAGTHDDVRARAGNVKLHDSPFLKLPPVVRRLVEPEQVTPEANVACREALAACRKELVRVGSTLDSTGISLTLVYRLDYIRHLLDRLYVLLGLISPPSGQVAEGAGFRFVQSLIRGGVRDRSLYELGRTNSRLLARRIIERAGRTGEHYITRTRAEQHDLVSSASGGGALTAFAVMGKFLISWAKLPVLVEGLGIAFNYSAAFVAMHLCGFTLATKQPSMTAATLAHSIKEIENETAPDLTALVDQVERTVRSQFAAALGNVGMVIPVAVMADLAVWLSTGHHFVDAHYADKIIAAHNPITSLTWVYATLTGGYLWFASIAGGAVENWFVVRKLPDSLASNYFMRKVIGAHRAQALGRYLEHQIAGVAVATALGVQLGVFPMLASLIGITLEVRHLTFVTGQLAFAGMQRGAFGVLQPDYLLSLLSIGMVGVINFAVSFALALWVAFRARDVRPGQQLALLFAVLKRFRQRPLDFVRAPKDA
jgi:site-specific recombinase